MTGGELTRLTANFADEMDGAALYRALAEAEGDPATKTVFERLAAVEETHAQFWAKKIEALGARLPKVKPGFRVRALGFLARRFGPRFVLPTIQKAESRDGAKYDGQADAVAAGLAATEKLHATELAALQAAPASKISRKGPLSGSQIAKLEGRRHNLGGNALRAAVLGANDGLVSNMSLVMGVAGAAMDESAILLTGVAGLIAGACSMALGEWQSVTSSRELYENEIRKEAEELALNPEEERKEISLIYQSKGLPEAEAEELSKRLMKDQKSALDTLAREELGIDPDELGGSAWVAGGTSFVLFAIGAIIPVLPFFFLGERAAIIASLVAGSVGLFAIGVMTSLFTGRGWLFSGTRQLLIGLAAAAITYGVGMLFSATLA
jgi:VIT1/CCC1 family predicted Fe2+/Mn2+ transporter